MNVKRDLLLRKEKIIYLPLEKVEPNPSQPRRSFSHDALCELAASIRENGILQPITVRLCEKKYLLVAGERRLRAAYIAGLSEIPCVVVEADSNVSASLSLIENVQRADLNCFEEALGIRELIRRGYSQEEVAKKLGRSQSAVSNKLRLLSLDSGLILRITAANLTERHARALLRLSRREDRSAALDRIIKCKMNVEQAEQYIESLLGEKKSKSQCKAHYVIKDMRIFYNTVNRAVDTMRRSGIKADIERTEDEHVINMSIRIFK